MNYRRLLSFLLTLCMLLSLMLTTALAEETDPVSFTVTFNTNGGEPKPDNQNVAKDSHATQPADPTKSGSAFSGWYWKDELNDAYKVSFDTYVITGDTTFYAQWSTAYKVNTPEATENGSVTVSAQDAAKDQTVTITVKPDDGFQVDKVTVTDQDGKAVEVKDNGDGTYSFTMPASPVDVAVTFAPAQSSEKFVDVPKGSWFHDPVYWAVDKGITDGVDDTHFAPAATCTRAQMVTFLWRAAGQPAPTSTSTYFLDVDTDVYYFDAVLWAVDKGITEGTSDTTFSPNAAVTRAQTVTFLYRYEQSEGGGFTGAWAFPLDYSDASDVPDWAYEPFCWMTMNKVVEGSDGGKLLPNDNCTRAQIVTMMSRYFEG